MTPQNEKNTEAGALYLRTVTLAKKLGMSRTYLWAMRRAGFEMPGGRATVEEARAWLRANPHFRANRTIVNRREHP